VRRRATRPSDAASYVWTFSSSQVAAGLVLAYRRADPVNPIDTSSGQANPSSTAIVAPSVQVASSGSMLVSLVGVAANAGITPPAGMAERAEVAGGRSEKITVEASDAGVGAGATGTRTSTASRAGLSVGQLVVLRTAP